VEVGDFRYDEIYARNSHYKKENIMSRNIVKTSVLSLILLLSFTLLLSETLAEPPSNFHESDAGTASNPYLIANLANLRWLSETHLYWGGPRVVPQGYRYFNYFLQTDDIDASETIIWNAGSGFAPIGQLTISTSMNDSMDFFGHYDGGGFIICSLYIKDPTRMLLGAAQTGFIGQLREGSVKNTHLAGINYISTRNTSLTAIGGLVGRVITGTISDSSVSGSIAIIQVNQMWETFIGGLVGWTSSTLIEQSYANVHIHENLTTPHHFVGGMVGWSTASTIKNSFFYGSIYCESYREHRKGGFIGALHNSFIQNCYLAGTSEFVNMSSFVGSLTGSIVENCVWDIESSGIVNAYYFTPDSTVVLTGSSGLLTSAMKNLHTYLSRGWDFEDIWFISSHLNDGYPIFRYMTDDYTAITDTENGILSAFSHHVYPNPVRTGDVTFRANAVKPQMEISIYNVKGQLVKKSTDFAMGNAESRFVWDRKNDKGQSVAPGVYLYRINAGDEVSVGKLLIIK
jgi:hypothetical protein